MLNNLGREVLLSHSTDEEAETQSLINLSRFSISAGWDVIYLMGLYRIVYCVNMLFNDRDSYSLVV